VGQIVGEFRSMGSFQGFLIDADGSFHTITVPGALDTRAQGVNDVGEVVAILEVSRQGTWVF